MMNIPKKIYVKFRSLILYGLFGSVSAGLDFVVYTLLVTQVGFVYWAANCISVIAGITCSFTLNRQFNFKVKDKTLRRFLTFAGVGLSGMVLSNIILYVCIEQMELDQLISKLASIVLVVLFQFLLNKYVTFKQ